MPEVDQQKCNALYGDDAGSITDSKRVELTDAWETNNQATINTVAGDIGIAMAQFNREAGADPAFNSLLFGESEFNEYSDPRTWDYGGSDGYGEFGVDGEIFRAINSRSATLSQIKATYTATNQDTATVDSLINILKPESFFGPSYNAIRETYLERYQIDKCFLDFEISRNETIRPSDEALKLAPTAQLVSLQQQTDAELAALRERLADLEAGNLETENIGRRLFEGKTLEFKEQCFLLSNILNLAKIKEQFDHGVSGSANLGGNNGLDPLEKRLPYSTLPNIGLYNLNSTVMATGTPFGFINKLTQTPTKDAFFEMNNAQLSSLQPMMRLYKVIENERTTPQCPVEKQIEIKFDPSATQHGLDNSKVEDFLKERNNRNPGVGVKSFNFTYDGYNPYAIKKSISARLVIHANSFNELLLERTNAGSTDEYRYIDLVLRTGGTQTVRSNRQLSNVQIENLNKLNFRLKAVLGWQNPIFTNRGIFKSDVLSGINNQAVTLNLTPTVHDFAFDDIGRVTMTINYLAYIEDYYDNPSFNIFSSKPIKSDVSPTFNILIRNLEYRSLEKKCDTEELKKRKQDDIEEQNIKDDRRNSLRNLFLSLLDSGKIYNIDIEGEQIPIFGNGGPYGRASSIYNKDDILKKITRLSFGTTGYYQANQQASGVDLDPDDTPDDTTPLPLQNNVSFFYAGDLVDKILANISDYLDYAKTQLASLANTNTQIDSDILKEEKQKLDRLIDNFKKLRILLGPLEIVKPDSNETTIINLGDIPISFKHFMEWLTTKLLDKNIETFTLPSFLNSFFNQYIIDYLNQDICYGGKAKQRINLNQAALTEYRDDQDDDDTITEKCNTVGGIGGNKDDLRYLIKCPQDITVPYGSTIGERRCTRRLYIPQEMNPDKYPLLRVMGVRDDPRPDTGVCNEINYLAYYAGRTIPVSEMKGIKTDDHKKGIWHYQIGKDRGIVKSINLQKTDTPGLAEVRFEQDGYDGLRQLRVLYDVTIKTYLDVSLFPGTYIYVDPKGFDPSSVTADFDLTDLGIGGYCMVWKSEHTIVAGQPESTLYAKWVSSRDADVIRDPAEGEADETTDNCGTIAAE